MRTLSSWTASASSTALYAATIAAGLGGLLLEALRSTRHSSLLPLCLSPSLLKPLKPPFDLAVPPQVLTWNVGHNPVGIYQRNGHDIMLFHARNFGQLQFD